MPEKCHGMAAEKVSCSVLIEIHPLRSPAQGETRRRKKNDKDKYWEKKRMEREKVSVTKLILTALAGAI